MNLANAHALADDLICFHFPAVNAPKQLEPECSQCRKHLSVGARIGVRANRNRIDQTKSSSPGVGADCNSPRTQVRGQRQP